LRGGEETSEAGLGRLNERIAFDLWANDRWDVRSQRKRRCQTREKIHHSGDAMIGGAFTAADRASVGSGYVVAALAIDSMACSNTLAPASKSPGSALSASL
jgi:hypothetical protein